MRIEWQISEFGDWQADVLLLFGFESRTFEAPKWAEAAIPWLKYCSAVRDFEGRFKQAIVAYGPDDTAIPRALLVGLGKKEEFSLEQWRLSVATAVQKCKELKVSGIGLPLPVLKNLPLTFESALEEAIITVLLRVYTYLEYKTRDRDTSPKPVTLVLLTDQPPEDAQRYAVKSADAVASGIRLARDLTNGPSNKVTPSYLLETARSLADKYNFKLTVIDIKQAEAMGMGAFAAVARGSREPAYVIVLEHAPEDVKEAAPVVLIGKGITFDTGGISIKPSDKMDTMKSDMAGAAAVLGVFQAIGELPVEKRVIGIIPATENMPDGKAYKPGDIIRSLSGLTIEVITTDAEGRLILCDALTYAQRLKPALIVDIATLTGACIIALGDRVAGVMGNNEAVVKMVVDTGERVGERLWPLPLWDFYFEDLKSDVADFKNVGNRKAGSIIGGMFLKQFVSDDTPWIHIDIAGPAWSEKDLLTIPKGATGFGTRTLLEIARHWEVSV